MPQLPAARHLAIRGPAAPLPLPLPPPAAPLRGRGQRLVHPVGRAAQAHGAAWLLLLIILSFLLCAPGQRAHAELSAAGLPRPGQQQVQRVVERRGRGGRRRGLRQQQRPRATPARQQGRAAKRQRSSGLARCPGTSCSHRGGICGEYPTKQQPAPLGTPRLAHCPAGPAEAQASVAHRLP